MFATANEIYLAPWSRIPPYISGIFIGWLICSGGVDKITSHQVRVQFERASQTS